MPDPTESPQSLLTPPLRSLLSDIIDYAGLFPPADLPLRESLDNYAHYRRDPEHWMLARFVIPVSRLDDLTAFSNLFTDPEPFQFSVLGTGGATADAFLDAFARDLEAIDTFHDLHSDRVHAEVMEVPLPEALLGAGIPQLTRFFQAVEQRMIAHGTAKLDLFFEVPLDERTPTITPPILAAMADQNDRQSIPARSTLGFKMRTGGPYPEDVPAPQYVAFAIAQCRDAGVRFKATAGLHHPIRHYDDSIEATMHGFLNVFGAAVLADEHGLDPEAIETILREEDPKRFQFTKDEFAWGGLTADPDAIHHVRQHLATSFGSCSFDEPRDDLRELQLIR